MKVKDFVFETFLRLTSKTVPYGYEDKLFESMRELFPKGIQKDEWGNYFYKIGESRTIFAAHLDTVSKEYVTVTHVIDGNIIKTDGKTTLGADDKAGITVLLWMIENNVPGLYYFFIGEEVGCIGSGKAAKTMDFSHTKDIPKVGFYKGNYDRIISFDRRDVGSVITFQSSQRCCSNDFADALCSELNKNKNLLYIKDDGGVYTDSAEFTHLLPECTNISVGYYKEHTTNEHQDIEHLTNLAEACVNVDWENLPTKRDPSTYEYKDWSRSYSGYSNKITTNSQKDWRSRDYGYHDDWHDDEYGEVLPNRGKSNKRGKRGRGKKYYDNGTGLVNLNDVLNSDTKYDWILSKFNDTGLEYWELQIIKEQYLDMESDYDKFFYNYLVEEMYENGGFN
jgi:putative aminopeptidase FrvX